MYICSISTVNVQQNAISISTFTSIDSKIINPCDLHIQGVVWVLYQTTTHPQAGMMVCGPLAEAALMMNAVWLPGTWYLVPGTGTVPGTYIDLPFVRCRLPVSFIY